MWRKCKCNGVRGKRLIIRGGDEEWLRASKWAAFADDVDKTVYICAIHKQNIKWHSPTAYHVIGSVEWPAIWPACACTFACNKIIVLTVVRSMNQHNCTFDAKLEKFMATHKSDEDCRRTRPHRQHGARLSQSEKGQIRFLNNCFDLGYWLTVRRMPSSPSSSPHRFAQ